MRGVNVDDIADDSDAPCSTAVDDARRSLGETTITRNKSSCIGQHHQVYGIRYKFNVVILIYIYNLT